MTPEDDRYQRVNLRIPRDLHAQLMQAAQAKSHSMNAEIVQRLSDSFAPTEDALTAAQAIITNAQWLGVLLHEQLQRERLLRARLRELAPEDPLATPAPDSPPR